MSKIKKKKRKASHGAAAAGASKLGFYGSTKEKQESGVDKRLFTDIKPKKS